MKNIEVDWDNPSSLKKAITKLQIRRKTLLRNLGYNEINFNGSKYNLDTLIPVFDEMLNTNFSHYYENKSSKQEYYVYAHCNPLKKLDIKNNMKHFFLASKFSNLRFEPFYIGKGTSNRAFDLLRNGSHRKIRQQILKFNKEIDVCIIKQNLREDEAFSLESVLIDILGLKSYSDNGMLCNLDEGVDSKKRRMEYSNPLISKILKRNGFK